MSPNRNLRSSRRTARWSEKCSSKLLIPEVSTVIVVALVALPCLRADDREPTVATSGSNVAKAALVISGKVVDAATKQPIKEFLVLPGWTPGGYWNADVTITAADGHYRLRGIHEQAKAYKVKIWAEGYLSAVSREIKNDEGSVTCDFELVKGNEVAATVLTPESVPAAGAKVALGLANRQIRVENGEVDSLGDASAFRETDAAGRFHLMTGTADFWLVVTHPSGCVQLNGLRPTNPSVIRLGPWARAEGTFRVARKPRAHVEVSVNGLHSLDWQDACCVLKSYRRETDSNGRFVFERVIPRMARIGRYFALDPKDDKNGMRSACWLPATFAAGKTTTIDLGTTGRPVIGQLRRHPADKENIPWDRAIVAARPDVPGAYANPHFYHFTASVDSEGNFAIDDVPVGDYVLDVQIINQGVKLTGHSFSVPAINEKLSRRPVDLGVLTLAR
jgi:hypothetical protein